MPRTLIQFTNSQQPNSSKYVCLKAAGLLERVVGSLLFTSSSIGLSARVSLMQRA